MSVAPGEITGLLAGFGSGQNEEAGRLVALVHAEPWAIAGRCMRRERADHTLPAALPVHEAYLSLAGRHEIQWQNPAHFFGFAVQVMRHVLLDYAREHRALKRGGAGATVTLDDALLVTEDHLDNIVIPDDSLRRLAAIDPKQIAKVKRHWTYAKAWLRRDMNARCVYAAG